MSEEIAELSSRLKHFEESARRGAELHSAITAMQQLQLHHHQLPLQLQHLQQQQQQQPQQPAQQQEQQEQRPEAEPNVETEVCVALERCESPIGRDVETVESEEPINRSSRNHSSSSSNSNTAENNEHLASSSADAVCYVVDNLDAFIATYLDLIESYKSILHKMNENRVDHTHLRDSYSCLKSKYAELSAVQAALASQSNIINNHNHNNNNQNACSIGIVGAGGAASAATASASASMSASAVERAHLTTSTTNCTVDEATAARLAHVTDAYRHMLALYSQSKSDLQARYNKLHDHYLRLCDQQARQDNHL